MSTGNICPHGQNVLHLFNCHRFRLSSNTVFASSCWHWTFCDFDSLPHKGTKHTVETLNFNCTANWNARLHFSSSKVDTLCANQIQFSQHQMPYRQRPFSYNSKTVYKCSIHLGLFFPFHIKFARDVRTILFCLSLNFEISASSWIMYVDGKCCRDVSNETSTKHSSHHNIICIYAISVVTPFPENLPMQNCIH